MIAEANKSQKEVKFSIGDLVMRKRELKNFIKPSGFSKVWLGPFEIVEDCGKGVYGIRMIGGSQITRIHGRFLKRWFPQHESMIHPEGNTSEDFEDRDFQVEGCPEEAADID